MARFWQSLSDPNQRRTSYLARAWFLDVPLTLLIVAAFNFITHTPWPDFSSFSLPRVLFAMCFFAPVAETLLMVPLFWLIRVFIKREEFVPLASALMWAGFHSLAAPWWGLQIFWSFYIFSMCYVTWQKRSTWQAIGMTAALHILHNCVPAVFLVFSRVTHSAP
ncbi:hypothetical protein [Oleiharenicola lentus]|uniref:hypothetical protein n=1 Tax=Oleiharenicola lentus TaxID=2508720 RepID=UPI003F66ED9F